MSMTYRFVILISIFLLKSQFKEQSLSYKRFYHKKSYLSSKLKQKTHQNIKNRGVLGALDNAIQLGYKKKLPKEIKEQFKTLGLLHLFTPSGLHFYPIFLILRKIFAPKILIFFLISLRIFLYFQTGFFALKRIIFLKTIYLITKEINIKKRNLEISFFLTFLIDFIWGSFDSSILSFTYSFLFLGLLLIKSKNTFYLNIFYAQIIAAFSFHQSFNPIYSVLGIFISSMFSFIFPLLFINFWIPILEIQTLSSDYILKKFIELIFFTRSSFKESDSFELNFIIIWVLFFWRSQKKSKTYKMALLFSLFLQPTTIA